MADPQIRVITGLLRQATERVVTVISVNATAELVETTPVDTGWARANWVPSVGSPILGSSPNRAAEGGLPAQLAQQQSGIAAVVGGYRLERGPVFITNNVPYITRLNEGSSTQAPSAFIQAAIQKAVRSLGDRIPQ